MKIDLMQHGRFLLPRTISYKNNIIHIPYKCELLYSNVSFDKISDTERIATGYCALSQTKSLSYSRLQQEFVFVAEKSSR